MPDSRRCLSLSRRGGLAIGKRINGLNAHYFSGYFVYSSDIDVSSPFITETVSCNEFFGVPRSPASYLIVLVLELGGYLGILRACRCISKASAARRDFCRAVFAGSVGVRRWCALLR